MPHAGLSTTVARARRAVFAEAISDGRLLSAFVASRDADSFAGLVTRFGPMVFAVCRRLTGHYQDAEDAFQATFIILARKAASIRSQEAVGNWLYGVAVKVAREARVVSAKRRAREILTAQVPDVARTNTQPDDLAVVLHEELAELPDKFRMLLVLCDLRGEPQTVVASRLGLPVGTVYSRLATARRLLADRLRKRGLALSVGALSVSLAQAGRAAVPTGLSGKAVAAAVSPGSVSAVAALSNGVLRAMFFDKLKTTAPLAAVALGLATCAVFAAQPGADTPGSPNFAPPLILVASNRPIPAKAATQPLPKSPNRILIRRDGMRGERTWYLLDPDGKNEKKIGEKTSELSVVGARLAPDGMRLATQVYGNHKPGEDPDKPYLYVRSLDEKEPGTYLGVAADDYIWSRDGTELACSEIEDRSPETQPPYESTHFILNVKTKEKTALKLPSDHLIAGWSPEGKFFLTEHRGEKPKPFSRLYLINRDGSERKALTGENERAGCGRLSPDGSRVLYAVVTSPPEKPSRLTQHEMVVLDIAKEKVTKVQEVPLNVQLLEFCWSPDGKQIAYLWRTITEGDPNEGALEKETETHLIVCAPDGSNPKTILSEKGTGIGMALSELDWR